MQYGSLFAAFVCASCTQFPPLNVTPTPALKTLDQIPPPACNNVVLTGAEFDTTSAEDKARATVVASFFNPALLGTTIATLGSLADPGIWMKTSLVTAVVSGRIDYAGKSLNLELRPSGGDTGSGSQISLPAMRLLEAPLTGFLELQVYRY